MNFTDLALLLLLAGTACSLPTQTVASSRCQNNCDYINGPSQESHFQHVSDLNDTSVAPWTLGFDTEINREPYVIAYATCNQCNVNGMIARPIYLEIYVYRRPLKNTVSEGWCRCPYNLAVGCTCVSQQ